MFKFVFTLFLSVHVFAGGIFYRQAKALAYENPKLLSTALVESLTHKCTFYATSPKPAAYSKFFVLDCYYSVNKLFEILNLYPFEVEKGTILPISFSDKLLRFASSKNILTFLNYFNTKVNSNKIAFLKAKVPELLSQYTTFDEFISVLFQDTSPSHLLFLKKYASKEAYEIISTSNKVFFQSLSSEEEREQLFGSKENVSNPYHFYVIRHLSKTLSKSFKYELSAFVAYLFNYSYEIFESDFKAKYLLDDPENLQKINTSDLLIGLKGAYYQDNFNSQLAQEALKTSNITFLKNLGSRVPNR